MFWILIPLQAEAAEKMALGLSFVEAEHSADTMALDLAASFVLAVRALLCKGKTYVKASIVDVD